MVRKSKTTPQHDPGKYELEAPEAYAAGRRARRDDCPAETQLTGVSRTAWFVGYYDEYFAQRYARLGHGAWPWN
jgi:hypothetical protein